MSFLNNSYDFINNKIKEIKESIGETENSNKLKAIMIPMYENILKDIKAQNYSFQNEILVSF